MPSIIKSQIVLSYPLEELRAGLEMLVGDWDESGSQGSRLAVPFPCGWVVHGMTNIASISTEIPGKILEIFSNTKITYQSRKDIIFRLGRYFFP